MYQSQIKFYLVTQEYFNVSTAQPDQTQHTQQDVDNDNMATKPYIAPKKKKLKPKEDKPKLGSYKIQYDLLNIGRKIDRGGMGVVYEGRFNNDPVAIKEIDVMSPKNKPKVADDIKEIALHCGLNHRNVIRSHGYSENGNSYFIVMDLMHASIDCMLYGDQGCVLDDGQQYFVVQEFLR